MKFTGGMYLPSSDSGRLIVGTWWLGVLVVVTTYCGEFNFLVVNGRTSNSSLDFHRQFGGIFNVSENRKSNFEHPSTVE